jgi:AraC-like DNA-binding protein
VKKLASFVKPKINMPRSLRRRGFFCCREHRAAAWRPSLYFTKAVGWVAQRAASASRRHKAETAWRRPREDGGIMLAKAAANRIAALAMKRGKSVDFTGYWAAASLKLDSQLSTDADACTMFGRTNGRQRRIECGLAPAEKWNVARLAKVANLSLFHLCHVFRQMVGTSIYDYVVHERLARTLDAVLDRGDDLTTIALDAGFASHSHFTARFRGFFGYTPAALRLVATTEHVAEIRKIMTASRLALS